MRFGFLILVVGLLVGCGSKNGNSVKTCYANIAAYENLPKGVSLYDKSRAQVHITTSCEIVFDSNKLFKKLALKKVPDVFGDLSDILIEEMKVDYNSELDYRSLVFRGVPRNPVNDRDLGHVYLINFDHDDFEWKAKKYRRMPKK